MRFTTESGSQYEVEWDEGVMHVTKLKGVPTARTTPGRMCLNTDEPRVGEPWLIHWATLPDGTMQCTLTTRVTEVISDA